MADQQESFVVDDSDEQAETDIESTDDEIYGENRSIGRKSNAHPIMESDVDSLCSDEDDEDDDHSLPQDFNASISKAIRRSLHKIGKENIPDSDMDHEDNGQSSDSDNNWTRSRIKNRVMSGSGDSSICSQTDEDDKPKNVKKKFRRIKIISVDSDSDEDDDEQLRDESRRGKFSRVMNDTSEDDVEMITKTISNLSTMSMHIDVDESTNKTANNIDESTNTTANNLDESKVVDVTTSMHIDVDESTNKTANNLDESKIVDITTSSADEDDAEKSIVREAKIVNNSKEKLHTSGRNNIIDDDSSSDEDVVIQETTNKNDTLQIDDSDSSNHYVPESSHEIDDLPVFKFGKTERPSSIVNIQPSIEESYQNDDIDEQIDEVSREILKSKKFLSSCHVDNLPDGGLKMRENISILEEKLSNLKAKLNNNKKIKSTRKSNEIKTVPFMTSSPYNFDNKKNTLQSQINDIKINYNDSNESSSDHDVGSTSSDSDNDDDDDNKFSMNNRDNMLHKLLYQSPKAGFDFNKLGDIAKATFEREEQLTVETLKNFHGSLETCPDENVLHKDPRGLKINLMPHQKHALAWLLWREKQKPPSGLLADDMGLGKTLTMISLVMESNEIDGDDDSSKSSSEDEWISKKSKSNIKYHGNTLVVCPASLINQWAQEIKERVKPGILSVDQQHGPNRETSISKIANKDIVLTTYAILSRAHKSHTALFRIKWKRVILDESHVIRNHKSQCSEAVCDLMADKRWAMTGTPIHNKEMDLYALLKFLKISPFDDIRTWKRWVDNKDSAGHERLATVIKTLMLRRTKDDLTKKGLLEKLPEKMIDIIWVDMDPEEKVIYQKVMLYSKTLFAQFLSQRADKQRLFEIGGQQYADPTRYFDPVERNFNRAQQRLLATHAEVKSHEILVLLLRLRQVCCHLSLIHAMLDQDDLDQSGIGGGHDVDADILLKMSNMGINKSLFNDDNDAAGDDDDDMGVDERVKNNLLTSDNPVFERERKSSKLRAVIELVTNIIKKDEKVIVVSQWTTLLNIVAENLDEIKNATYKKFTGQVAVKDRQEIINAFNNDIDPRILLLSLTAGGVGLNLVGANHLILMDIHWNPQLESQAQDRIYRFGQNKNVTIYKVLMTDSIEERIKLLQEKKLQIASSVLTGSGKVTSSKLTLDDLKSLFGFNRV
ncbi:hypothetical protein HCN44_004031 [Aphidius gifuensis]|uniref:Transcription termination factor 2 n=1 Tax=Aphidius gifuensis TaxID=684658 RepID=A0A835CS35_APHGI|nr:transcription termination factor 2-like [Aphidius gifuensis]KAF7994559.1 hypothetical protein HCN44_004031 [Aphidius gifuensis]